MNSYKFRYKHKPHKKPIGKSILIITNVLMLIVGILVGYVLFAPIQPQGEIITTSKILTASTNVVAVSNDQNYGILGKVKVQVTDGDGLILINTNPFLEPDTQYSANVAVEVAKRLTNKDLSNKNVIFDFEMGNASVVGGPSAGAAMTIATIAAVEDKKINDSVAITGTIFPDGSIGKIGGVIEKARAAAENNKTLFLVPLGQSKVTYYEQKIEKEKIGAFIISRVNYVPKILDLSEYAQENWNLTIKEVNGIDEVVEYMIE